MAEESRSALSVADPAPLRLGANLLLPLDTPKASGRYFAWENFPWPCVSQGAGNGRVPFGHVTPCVPGSRGPGRLRFGVPTRHRVGDTVALGPEGVLR